MTSTERDAFSAALLEFLRATRRTRGRLGDGDELSLSQYQLLEPLIGGERLATCELALAAGVSAPTATRMLTGLEREGLVERVPCDADRRVVHVVLTDRRPRAGARGPRARRGAPSRDLRLAQRGRAPRGRAPARAAGRRGGGPAVKPTTRTLLPLAGAALAYSLAQTMVIPALPELQQEFHAGPADATWLLTAFLLTSSIATPLLGRLGDMHGKEHWLLISLAIFGVGSLVAAVAGSLTVMIAGRAIQGAGGAIFPLAIGIIRDEFPRDRVAPAIGTVSAMFGIGGGSGLVLAGIFVDHGSISWIFWLSVATTALAALATWLWVPESPVRVRARIDWVGGALLSMTLLALLLPISEGNTWGWTSPRVLGLFAAAAVFAVLWARWELRVVDPLVDLALMRQRPVWTTNVAACAIGFAMFGSFVLVPQFVQTPARGGLRVRRLGHGVRALPAPLGPPDALRRPAQRTPGRALRVARAARARALCRPGSATPCSPPSTARASTSTCRASCSASGSGSRWRRWPISSSRPYPLT